MNHLYETTRVVPLDVQFEFAFMTDSIHTDNLSVTVRDYIELQASDDDFYFEPDFK